jgi:hypothetical protein
VGGLDRMRQVGRTATAGEASAGLVAEIAAAAARHADVGADDAVTAGLVWPSRLRALPQM